MEVVRVPHAEISYERVAGPGDPTVLVHGLWTDRRGWDAVLPRLAGGLDVLAYDRRGHGRSSGAARPRPVEDDAHDLVALLEAVDFRPVHLIAHDYGGAVALRVAVERPEFVRSITVHEPPCFGLLPEPVDLAAEADLVLRSVEEIGRRPAGPGTSSRVPDLVGRLSGSASEWEQLDPAARSVLLADPADWLSELDDHDCLRPEPAALRSVVVPVLVTSGERSAATFPRLADRVAELLPNSTRLVLPQVAHFPQLARPDLFVGVVGSFLLDRNVPTT